MTADENRERTTESQHTSLKQSAVLEVVLDDHVRDGVEHELDVAGVGGARQMGVDLLLVFPLVEVLELHPDVAGRFLVRVGTGILWEADDEWRSGDLLLEQVLLVQKQDDRRIDEPL